MTRTSWGILAVVGFLASLAFADESESITVDCGHGQSLNQALAKLNKHRPVNVSVKGTCTEYVQVVGFDGLVLKGQPGAMLQQPTSSPGNLANDVLYIQSSHSVTVDGFTIQAPTTGVPAVGIGQGSRDIRLRNLNVIGGVFGIIVFENSQVSIAYVTAQDPGYATLGAYDLSDIHLEHSSFTNTTGAPWHAGLDIGASHVTMYATTITNMQQGILAHNGSIIDLVAFNTYYNTGGSTDVTMNSPAGTNYNGVTIQTGGSLNLNSAKLVINQPGQSGGSTTGGILLSDNAALNAGTGLLAITGSNGQGILALNNSHATIVGVTVTGGTHAGLLAANLSTIHVAAGPSLTLVGGNSVDLFCDAGSIITGAVNLAGVPTSSCANVLSAETPPLP
jgi:hypothetical protein